MFSLTANASTGLNIKAPKIMVMIDDTELTCLLSDEISLFEATSFNKMDSIGIR